LRARVIHLFIWCAALGACASAPLKPEAALPTRAQLAALLAAPGPPSKHRAPSTFTLAAPRVILEGNAFAVTCYVPESLGPGHIRVALEGVNASVRDIRSVETSLQVRPGCGTWVATCLLQTATGLTRRLEQNVLVKGGLCEDDGGGF
jgi:hypothetical protein